MTSACLDSWLSYLEDGKLNSELQCLELSMGPVRLRVALSNVMDWLKDRATYPAFIAALGERESWARMESVKFRWIPMHLPLSTQWVDDVREVMEQCVDARAVFHIYADKFDFADTISQSYRSELLQEIGSRFTPPLFVTRHKKSPA